MKGTKHFCLTLTGHQAPSQRPARGRAYAVNPRAGPRGKAARQQQQARQGQLHQGGHRKH
eukprot:1129923-Pelagomonas_calceolata.AAC.1